MNPLIDSFSAPELEGLILGSPLGQGGMSQVRLATTVGGDRVAVKLPRDDGANAAARALIRREYRYLAAISHPNIVAVAGLGRFANPSAATGYEPGIVMQYLGGGDLVSLAGAPPRRWVPMAAQVARAVDHLHCTGIVHRDIKPRNVLLGLQDAPRLIDFALAARIGSAAPKGGGTAAYRLAAQAGEASVIEDVYAFAVLVYELWMGGLPFGRDPEPGACMRWRGVAEFKQASGVRGLRHLAAILSGVLMQRKAVLSAGIGPLRHALESVVMEH